jgi:hypothetical protein
VLVIASSLSNPAQERECAATEGEARHAAQQSASRAIRHANGDLIKNPDVHDHFHMPAQ